MERDVKKILLLICLIVCFSVVQVSDVWAEDESFHSTSAFRDEDDTKVIEMFERGVYSANGRLAYAREYYLGASLVKAAYYNRIELAKYLLFHGADPDSNRCLPLHYAANFEHYEMMNLLIANGASMAGFRISEKNQNYLQNIKNGNIELDEEKYNPNTCIYFLHQKSFLFEPVEQTTDIGTWVLVGIGTLCVAVIIILFIRKVLCKMNKKDLKLLVKVFLFSGIVVLVFVVLLFYIFARAFAMPTEEDTFEERTELSYPDSARVIYFQPMAPLMQDPYACLVFDANAEDIRTILAEPPFENMEWELSDEFRDRAYVREDDWFRDAKRPFPAVAHWAFNITNDELNYFRQPKRVTFIAVDETRRRVWLYYR